MATQDYNINGYNNTGEFNNPSPMFNTKMLTTVPSLPTIYLVYKGKKQLELSNHLGNVLATITDRRIARDDNGDLMIDYYNADISSTSDYYAFGSAMPGREIGNYRYGFNGKELDKNEEGMGGGGSTYDYGFRIYNPNLGKFLSIDPLTYSYPWYTPYQFAGNTPIQAIDIDGLEEYKIVRFLNSATNTQHTIIKLVNANAPWRISYYNSNLLFSNCTDDKNPEGYIETLENVITDLNTGFNTDNEFHSALNLYNSWLNRNLNYNSEYLICETYKEIVTPSTPKPTPAKPTPGKVEKKDIPYLGKTLKRKSTIDLTDGCLGWFSTSTITGGGPDIDGTPVVSGNLTYEGKRVLRKFAKSINSMSSSPTSLTLNAEATVGSTVSDSEFMFASNSLATSTENAKKYLISKLKNKKIKVYTSSNVYRTDKTGIGGVKVKID